MLSAMESPFSFQEAENGSILRLEWDNRRLRKGRFMCCFLAVFWIIWAPIIVILATGLFLEDAGARLFSAIWLIFGLLGTLGISSCLLGATWREWIEISEEEVCHGREGLLAPRPKHFPIPAIDCIFLGHEGIESIVTLSIFLVRRRFTLTNRHLFGYCLTPELKDELYNRIETFVAKKGLPLCMNKE